MHGKILPYNTLRFGTPPIVHRVGGLADTVIDETSHQGAGTGFSFASASVGALLQSCLEAQDLRAAGGKPWESLLDRGMAVDFDWVTGSAPKYVDAYRRATAIRRASIGVTAPDGVTPAVR